jgi:hypothetical protein
MNRLLLALVIVVPAAAQVAHGGGVIADGAVGSGPRPSGQLLISNAATGGHSIVTLDQTVVGEESAIESIGTLSDGAIQQQGAQFWRWVNGNSGSASFESSWSNHLTQNGADNTPLILLGRNSVKLCGGSTSGQPWQTSLPPTSWVDVRCSQRIAGYLVVGPDLDYDRHSQVGLTVEDGMELGDSYAGHVNHALQMGYSAGSGAAFVQAYHVQGGGFMPLIVAGSEMTIGYGGQKIGFLGATPVARPSGTCSVSGGSCARTIAAALAALGLASITVVP